MELKARRNFYANGRIKGKRRIIEKGDIFQTDEAHAQDLQRKRLAVPVSEYETQTIEQTETQTTEPTETQTPADTENTQAIEPTETPETAERLHDLEYKELKQMAKDAGIKGYNRMKKDDLIKELGGRQNGRR